MSEVLKLYSMATCQKEAERGAQLVEFIGPRRRRRAPRPRPPARITFCAGCQTFRLVNHCRIRGVPLPE